MRSQLSRSSGSTIASGATRVPSPCCFQVSAIGAPRGFRIATCRAATPSSAQPSSYLSARRAPGRHGRGDRIRRPRARRPRRPDQSPGELRVSRPRPLRRRPCGCDRPPSTACGCPRPAA
ncbi:hypothetical protein NS354_10655 [Leucobacter chromiiresistens]|uniref:Uncharacterized protein n=1 Tax=Leucobacter chromiiresistens TaxID=1079994 RepID=A0A147EFS6_9MICO|nr:hypothetical protein NS354_10655 [Leucobacter chromiiresistens]